MSDEVVISEVARRLQVNRRALDGYVVDRPKTGNLVVRPEAVYG